MSERNYTADDLDALTIFETSPGYALLRQQTVGELERRQFELEAEMTPEKTAFVRGRIAALRDVLRFPEVLRGDIERDVKARKRKED